MSSSIWVGRGFSALFVSLVVYPDHIFPGLLPAATLGESHRCQNMTGAVRDIKTQDRVRIGFYFFTQLEYLVGRTNTPNGYCRQSAFKRWVAFDELG